MNIVIIKILSENISLSVLAKVLEVEQLAELLPHVGLAGDLVPEQPQPLGLQLVPLQDVDRLHLHNVRSSSSPSTLEQSTNSRKVSQCPEKTFT